VTGPLDSRTTGGGRQLAVTLARGGAMPLVGLGTWQLTGSRCHDAVRAALDVGYRLVDTAAIYGNEREVGRAARDSGVPREAVFVTTKLAPGDAGRERRAIAASLRALGMAYVDLWLVHWPPRGQARPETWKQLLAVRDEGLARAVGVSNYRTSQLDEHVDHGVVVIPKSRAPERIAANFDLFGFSLTGEELRRIDALSAA
jgi:2,5-diketo-D-gluconate reductase A